MFLFETLLLFPSESGPETHEMFPELDPKGACLLFHPKTGELLPELFLNLFQAYVFARSTTIDLPCVQGVGVSMG